MSASIPWPSPSTARRSEPTRQRPTQLLGPAGLALALLWSCTPSGSDSAQASSAAQPAPSDATFAVQALVFETDRPYQLTAEATARAAQGQTAELMPGDGSLAARVAAAEARGELRLLTAPTVLTREGQFTVQTGVQIPIQTTKDNQITVQFVNATLRFEGSVFDSGDAINLDLDIMKRRPRQGDVDPGAPGGQILTTEARLSTRVSDGGTAALHGIYDSAGREGRGPQLVVFVTVDRQ